METLNPPESFDFPFPPYDIQHDFMTELYRVLEQKNYGIFESPTGTGKSLSIICGALRWLKDYNKHERESLEVKIHNLTSEKENIPSDSTDWITSQSKEIEITHKLSELKIKNDKIVEYYKKIDDLKSNRKKIADKKKYINKTAAKKDVIVENVGEDKIDVDDDDDELLIILDNLQESVEIELEEEENVEEKYSPVKIYICSRTHSQLTQFVGEIRKSPFGKDIRVVSLASRQNYCINPDVTKLKSASFINERCVDMQKGQTKTTKKDNDGRATKRQKSGSSCKCPYYKQEAIQELRDVALTDVMDIEDLVVAGKEFNACPYYATRKAVEDAEVILVPYNTILHKPTREANGISLTNNVIIIDEAHNLLEALAQMHSAEVTYEQLHHCMLQLKGYKMKYCTRFSAQNLLTINQLIFITTRLKDVLDKCVELKNGASTEIFTLTSFVLNAEIDNYNMFKIVKFVKDSKIAQKLHGFALRNPESQVQTKESKKGIRNFLASINPKTAQPEPTVKDAPKSKPPPSNPLLAVVSFLEALTYHHEDGRVLVHRADNKKLQFLLLNASTHFRDIVKEARSVIVAGGTMKPNSEFRERLFMNAGVESHKIIEFSCDHIIPPENILPVIIRSGPKNESLLFNMENRFKMGNNLKMVLQDACKKVKGGIVVFFPSYKYEAWVWQLVKELNFDRPVFREPQESGCIDDVLNSYQKAIHKPQSKGALLFSVVGGKLSEGLNFSDDLGRCVIVVGLPYANRYSPDLKEKMAFLDKSEGSGAGNKFYENICMKAVNQCIGRAVRHKNDFASVILLDERYDRSSTKNALPGWIKRSLKSCSYNEAFETIKKFFDAKKMAQ